MSTDCHVRKLRIRTRDNAILSRMTCAIEDALRTASFPGVPPNGRVFVKRLDLGNFSSSVSSRFLANRIDEQFRHISPVVLSQDTPELIGAPAVWFPDDLSPYRFLIRLLAKNQRPRAWYWKAAVKGWHPSFSVPQSYQVIVSRVSEYETGIRGLCFVLEPLVESGRILDVLDKFNPRDVTRYLFNLGLSPVLIDPMKETEKRAMIPPKKPMIVTSLEGGIITGAAGLWPIFDPRFALASYLVLARMNQAADPVHLNRLLGTVSNLPANPRDTQGTKKDRGNVGDPHQDAGPEVHRQIRGKLNQSGGIPSEATMQETNAHGQIATDYAESEFVYKNKPTAEPKSEQDGAGKAISQHTDSIYEKSRQPPEHILVDGYPQAPGPPGHTVASDSSGSPSPESEHSQSTPFRKHVLRDILPFLGGFAGETSEYAGLIFIIPLMKRIGVDTLMEKFPEYNDLDLPRHILFRCATLFSIPPDDPALAFLGEKPEPATVIPEFAAPPQWRRILPKPSSEEDNFRVATINGFNGYGLLLDSENPLMIGVWRRKNRYRVAPWLDRYHINPGPVVSQDWSLDRLVDTMVTAMERYCRDAAAMELRDLIRRPAYIATTKTHLDLTFPFSQLDIRVRMAGLDINPGWVPWLGRVFQFHYVGGDS
ncbi:hypothetical protein [Desulfobacter hydrogenophilus]|nr:hypothetical protein [Desulfobacter hydrogenophilus]NDY71159.1 hypothetical protein [Desulfobacter hydrogenophilus]QBH14240.1 hypothetical protein EYB58_15755 [Desulfobacter hydrogenophilus]